MGLAASEFILNPDGSIYHLQLKPEQLANTVITVGDPDRVDLVTQYFDEVEFSIKKREFHTQTGTLNGQRITVISTGIGTDNIDIVLNELDALVNIDFETRKVKEDLSSLNIIRIGTSGSIQKDVPLNSFLISEMAVGLDSLLNFYECGTELNRGLSDAFVKHTNWHVEKSVPYAVSCDDNLKHILASEKTHLGITATNVGFYGPQGRILRLALQDGEMNSKLSSFSYEGKRITNLEMETSGIYGLSKLLGHRAISMNAIVANRASGTFSEDSAALIDSLIKYTLERISQPDFNRKLESKTYANS
ncbi:MAG TPA: nucleoside phosphorylase [Salinimicrobium sp.]|nr:nucleoside phosphorylase [Salinimicrobium sp.]